MVVNFYDPSIPTGLTLEPGGPIEQDYRQPLQLKATLLPKGEAESEITWKASPSGNVTITDGLVQAKKACKVTITATAKKNSKAKASVVVNFYDPTIPTALRLEPSGSFDYNYYTPLKLQVILETEGVAESEITWKANPSKNVSIAADGTITAKKFGKVTITATAKRNSKAKASVTVNFTDMSVPTGLELDKHGTIEIDLKEEVQLTATLLPAELAQSDILWSSSDPKFASVTSSGLVKGVGEGEATITATAAKNTNARDSVTFKVVDRHAPISVSIDQGDTQNMVIGGEDLTLTASLAGQEGYEPETTLTWSSSDAKVATVTQSGVVHAVGVGTTTITVTTHNGKTDSCTVEVKEPDPVMVDGIVLNETEKTLGVGETLSLTAEVSPEDATNRDVIWSTNKESVASVDENGLVTAAGAGEATITATAADGSGKKAECKITVVQKVTGITLNKDEETLDVGSTLQLTADVSPDSATNKDVTWSTSDKEVADVDENGLVTAVGTGEATITATAADGSGVKAECKVSVPFEGFTFRTLSDDTVEITGYRGTDTDLVIPATISGKTVSAIGAEAFKGNASITSVEVQSNAVTVIGQSAFENCTALVSVDLPDSVQTIGAAAFKNCVKLESMS